MSKLKDLNLLRQEGYKKDHVQEDFLLKINKQLRDSEVQNYSQNIEEKPLIFIFGIPRSGTTLTAQLASSGLETGYINNFVARFWLSPITGIKLSKIIHGEETKTDFHSNYATTKNIGDIHEFGYFWRHWLKINSIEDTLDIVKRENEIDWTGLKKTILNIQNEFDKPLVFKNIFGAYHLSKFIETFKYPLWIYIERDPIDNIISIIEARKKFYSDPNIWWSTVPPEYQKIKNFNYIKQICSQVYYLNKFYKSQMESIPEKHVFRVNYQDICSNPEEFIKEIKKKIKHEFNYDINIGDNIPDNLSYRKYDSHIDLEKVNEEYNRLISNE